MDYLSFEEANNLDWSNDFLDFIIGANLFLSVYSDRTEAKSFRTHKGKLIKLLNETITTCVLQEIETIRSLLNANQFGMTREDSVQFFSNLMSAFSPASYFNIANESNQNSPRSSSFIENPNIKRVCDGFVDFSHRYGEEYVRAFWGGTFPTNDKENQLNNINEKMSAVIALIKEPVIECLEGFIDLCFDAGLKCWWAPLMQFNSDVSDISPPLSDKTKPQATIDGILGPFFKRDITTKLYSSTQLPAVKKQVYEEWLLAAMSRKEARNELGTNDGREIHRLLEDWGYHHGIQWERDYFDCLFDRIYLKLGVRAIAQKRHLYESVVQRNTFRIAKLLMLDIPRAKRSFYH
ncbi:hypothetical protein ACFLYB_00010 [Chloroflexota bacterium]